MRFYDTESECWSAVSWNNFREKALRLAQGLVRQGVKPQDRVLLLSENRVEWLLCDLAIQAAGAVTVPVYANLLPSTVQVIAEDSEACLAIVSDASQAAKIAALPDPPPVASMEVEIPRWLNETTTIEVAARLRNLCPENGEPHGHGLCVG